MLNLTQKNKITNVLLFLIGFVLFFEVLFYPQAVVNWLNNIVEKIGVWGWVAIAILQFLQVLFIPIPAYFITLTSMKMYNNQLILLFFITLAVLLLGVIIAYLIGLKWGKKAVVWCAGSEEEYDKWLSVLKSKKTNLFYLASVLLPVFPDDVLCIMAGSIKMNFGWFLFCNIIGRAIGLFTFMFVFKSISNSPLTIIFFSVLFVSLIIYKIIIKRKLKNEFNNNRE